MSLDITPEIESHLKHDQVIWFTTVREDGMPQPTPVWFIWQDGSFLIYTTRQAQKARNIRANAKVAINLDNTHDGDSFTVFMGEATIDPTIPPPTQVPAYFDKYRQGITDIGMTPETFSVPIRVTPTHIRGE